MAPPAAQDFLGQAGGASVHGTHGGNGVLTGTGTPALIQYLAVIVGVQVHTM